MDTAGAPDLRAPLRPSFSDSDEKRMMCSAMIVETLFCGNLEPKWPRRLVWLVWLVWLDLTRD